MNFRILLVPVTLIASCVVANADSIEPTKDSLETVKKNIADKKAVLLDVREKDEWNSGHLKDAIPLPLSSIEKGTTAAELTKLAGKDTVIYLHCAAGVRSLKAAKKLENLGRDLRPLKPGYDALVKAGFEQAK